MRRKATRKIQTVRIVYPDTGIGLENDARIVASVLESAGLRVERRAVPIGCGGSFVLRAAGRAFRLFGDAAGAALYRWLCAALRPFSRDVVDLTVFLQRVFHTYAPASRRSIVIPNPEWFNPDWAWHLRVVDAVACKTLHAVDLLTRYSRRVEFIGFTSLDRDPDALSRIKPTETALWLHHASAGLQKGTQAVLAAWAKHPDWPMLTVLQHKNAPLGADAANVRYIARRLSEPEMIEHARRHAVHICPSESEGYGHSLVEAMSCAALVLTTDGAPMNELVKPDRGVLVATGPPRPDKLGIRYLIRDDDVEAAVIRALALDPGELYRLRVNARRYFDSTLPRFRSRLLALLTRL
ncbi:MAG: glycosyltransferase family 1 protein [Spirochaetaceae bacterium]|nr:MAG: glycosyltransferase family 1 protein [Spirochaetaceae bacterium]